MFKLILIVLIFTLVQVGTMSFVFNKGFDSGTIYGALYQSMTGAGPVDVCEVFDCESN
jgi:hypothetical protein